VTGIEKTQRERAPEGTYVNLFCFKRRKGLSNHLKEAAARSSVITSERSKERVQPKAW